MTPRELLDAFETLADAPDGIARLRELVLQLAVRGKLVPQDPEDEPASVLLEQIAAEKARLVKEGKIRKPKKLPPIDADEMPFEVPEGWEWCRFGEVAEIASNLVDPAKHQDAPHVAPNHIEKATGRLLPYGTIKEDGVKSSKHLFRRGQVLYSKIRPNLSKAVLVDFDGLCSADMYPLDSYIQPRYLHRFILSLPFLDEVTKDDNRLAMPKVNKEQLVTVPVPTPPLAEQHRIVARVDELMGLLDRLEAARDARNATRAALRDATLAALRDAEDADAVETAWSRVAEHMDELFTEPADVEPLRQTILQLAVRGRLVPQDPEDEPASVLLERIAAEKARLVKEKKIRKPKKLPPIEANEVPFQVPEGWEWCRFGEVFQNVMTGPFGTSLKKSEYIAGGTPVVNPQNLKNGQVVPTESTCVGPDTLSRLSTFLLETDDVVVARRGEMGRCAVVGPDEAGWLCGTGSLVLRPAGKLLPDFVALFLRCPSTVIRLGGDSVGSTMKNLNQRIMTNLEFGVPPVAEQHRIVARVDDLMGTCAALEEHLSGTQSLAEAFASAAVHHLDA